MNERDHKIDLILSTLINFREEFIEYSSRTDDKLKRMESALTRLENDQPKDVTAILEQINTKMEVRDSELQALNKRVFKVESEIERLTSQ